LTYNNTLISSEKLLAANDGNFADLALEVFHYQYDHNALYRDFCNHTGRPKQSVTSMQQIPFLPIGFFKTHKVVTGLAQAQLTFESSGTTGEHTSRHYVSDAAVYERSLLQGFAQFYGSVEQYAIIALLPSYLERKNASLVHMAKTLMDHSRHAANGFYINEWDKLADILTKLKKEETPTLLLGVTFALLDFAELHSMDLSGMIVMETGGMKGRREEWTRAQVHEALKKSFYLQEVHSEYGMTELLSQAYAIHDGLFRCTHTMRVFAGDINDPMDVATQGSGRLNIIDLANIHSCSFIATEDLGRVYADSSFEVLGRMDHSALRGCSLMAV